MSPKFGVNSLDGFGETGFKNLWTTDVRIGPRLTYSSDGRPHDDNSSTLHHHKAELKINELKC